MEDSLRRLDNIDLRLLRIFVVLAQSGGFSNAQIALNLSPSTLSTHLSALEHKLGGQLCQRGRAGFRLTPFGEAALEATLKLLSDVENFGQRLGEFSGRLTGKLRIGIVDGAVQNPALGLQRVIGNFIKKSDEVFIDLQLGTPNELEKLISNDERDIVIGPFTQRAPSIEYMPYCWEIQALYCGDKHELFRQTDAVVEKKLEQTLFSVRSYRHLDDLYRVNNPRSAATVMHMEAQEMLILSGGYVGFLPRPIGDSWVERKQMRCLIPRKYEFKSQHFIAIRREHRNRPIVDSFLAELTNNNDAS